MEINITVFLPNVQERWVWRILTAINCMSSATFHWLLWLLLCGFFFFPISQPPLFSTTPKPHFCFYFFLFFSSETSMPRRKNSQRDGEKTHLQGILPLTNRQSPPPNVCLIPLPSVRRLPSQEVPNLGWDGIPAVSTMTAGLWRAQLESSRGQGRAGCLNFH